MHVGNIVLTWRGFKVSLGLPRSKEVMLEVANRSLSKEEGGASGLITSESTCGHESICKTKEIGLF